MKSKAAQIRLSREDNALRTGYLIRDLRLKKAVQIKLSKEANVIRTAPRENNAGLSTCYAQVGR